MKRFSIAVGLTAVGALVISGCAPGGGGDAGDDSGLVEGSSITAAWNQAFYSMNGNTSFGNATANNNINYLVLDGFNYYNNTPELVKNESFGSYELVSEDPLVVTYTIADGVKWSDGTDVDALRTSVARELRTRLSPRHVPDELHVVKALPRTLSGKKLEVPVKKILRGVPADEAATRGALADPSALDEVAAVATAR